MFVHYNKKYIERSMYLIDPYRNSNSPWKLINPVSVWEMNDASGSLCIDSKGLQNINFNTMESVVILNQMGILNNCVRLSSTGYLPINSTPQYILGNGITEFPISFNIWFKVDNINNNQWIIEKRASETVDYLIAYYNGKIEVNLGDGKTNYGNYINFSSVNLGLVANTWTMLTVTYDGSKLASGIKVFKNGVLLYGTANTYGIYTGNTDDGSQIVIGGHGVVFTLIGSIDQTLISRKVLIQSEIDFLYNSGLGREYI